MKRRINTDKIRNNKPAIAATITSRPSETFLGSPAEVKTFIEPQTIKIRAMPPAMPRPIVSTLPVKAVGLVGILPRAVGHSVPAPQGLLPVLGGGEAPTAFLRAASA